MYSVHNSGYHRSRSHLRGMVSPKNTFLPFLVCSEKIFGFKFIFLLIQSAFLLLLLQCGEPFCSCCSYGCTPGDKSEYMISANLTEEKFQENPIINWDAILWVNRPLELWIVQVILAMISLTEALLLAYLGYKVSQICRFVSIHRRNIKFR
jgi:hypothetical protein